MRPENHGLHWMFHVRCPEGRIFSDFPRNDYPMMPGAHEGWVDTPAKLVLDVEKAKDQMVENAVKAMLKEQGPDRALLDAEHRKKYGEDPHAQATNKEVSEVIDNRRADGDGKLTPPKKSPTFTRNWERNK
jgi:hypothetical protein